MTRDSKKATEKAKKIVTAAVYRVLQHEPMEIRKVPINPDVLIVGGGGIGGIEAALRLANAECKVYLLEKEPSIGVSFWYKSI